MTAYQQAGLALVAIAVLIVAPTVAVVAYAAVMDHLADRRWRRG